MSEELNKKLIDLYNQQENEKEEDTEGCFLAVDGKVFKSDLTRRLYDFTGNNGEHAKRIMQTLRIKWRGKLVDFVPTGIGFVALRYFFAVKKKELKNKYFCNQLKKYKSLLLQLGIEADFEDYSIDDFVRDYNAESWYREDNGL